MVSMGLGYGVGGRDGGAYPEELARQAVNGKAGGALGEDGRVERDVALEHERVGLLLLGRGRAKVQGARDVCRAVPVLGARVAQIDGGGVDDRAGAPLGLVVDDSGTGNVSKRFLVI